MYPEDVAVITTVSSFCFIFTCINTYMKLALTVGIGSFIGGMLRYLISMWIHERVVVKFPLGTLLVNIIGCLLIGMVFEYFSKSNADRQWLLFATTGILGGFTTFSAFSFETVTMVREGQLTTALGYILASVVIGLAATYGGIVLARSLG